MLLGWIDFSWFATTLAYVSADAPTFVFSVNADVTGIVEPGMRIRLTQTTDKFFIVTAVGAFAAGVTPITVYGGSDYTLANATISAGAFSTHKKPFGFNASAAKWTQTLSDTSNRSQASPSGGTWYNPGSLSLSVPIGIWRLLYHADLIAIRTTASTVDVLTFVTLSTANNSESDTALTSMHQYEGRVPSSQETILEASLSTEEIVTLAAKTSYFLNVKNTGDATDSIAIRGDHSPTIVRAVCALL
jgi:hypothetical protein